MRFTEYLLELKDAGSSGKAFERAFMKACDMIGLHYETNGITGRGWDIKPVGDGWTKIISDRNVNIKIANTKWLFSSKELSSIVPWDDVDDENYNEKSVLGKIRSLFNRLGIPQTVFLKPKTDTIQQKIIDAVKAKDMIALDKLFIRNNFMAEKLGNRYEIRISNNDGKVGSIAVDKDGKVFMRSEKPRSIGGTVTVTFRTPTPKLSKKQRPIKR